MVCVTNGEDCDVQVLPQDPDSIVLKLKVILAKQVEARHSLKQSNKMATAE
jgi:hypothetical protein